MTRTPTPWRYQEGADAYTHIIRGPKNEIVAQLHQETSGLAEANARFIVQSCNAFDEMLSALESVCMEAKSWHTFHHGDTIVSCDTICACLPQMERAIAKAKAVSA